MEISKEEILNATRSGDVLHWMQDHPDEDLTEVAKHFNELCRKEFISSIPNYDPDMHYEVW